MKARMLPVRWVSFAMLLALGSSVARSQTVLYSVEGEQANANFSRDVVTIGDVNGDGVRDVLVGAVFHEVSGMKSAGRVQALDGVSGQVVWTVEGTYPNEYLGGSLAGLGDADGDGIDDVALGAPNLGAATQPARVFLHSGFDGALLHTITSPTPQLERGFAFHIGSAGDFDGDGFADVAIGEPGPAGTGGWRGKAYVYSGDTGLLIVEWDIANDFDHLGKSVAAIGDWDGDGRAELAVSADGYDLSFFQQAVGKVYVMSSSTHLPLLELVGEQPNDFFGYTVANAGDTNGDGIEDLVVGAYPYARIHLGPDGALAHKLLPETAGENFAWSTEGAGDVDADGHSDVLIGSAAWDPSGAGGLWGRAYVFSGDTGQKLFDVFGEHPYHALGRHCAGFLDADGDGFGEVVIGGWGAHDAQGASVGRIDVTGPCPLPFSTHCVAKPSSIPGCTPSITAAGAPSASSGSGFTIRSGNVPGGAQFGIFFYTHDGATAPASVPFGTLCIDTSSPFRGAPLLPGGTTGQCDGSYQLDWNAYAQTVAGSDPASTQPGTTVDGQFWYRDPPNLPAGGNLTDAIHFVICP